MITTTVRAMTIRKGEEWGERAVLPRGLPSAGDDASVARWFESAPPGSAEAGIVLHGGDLARTLGSVGAPTTGAEATRAVVDVLSVAAATGESCTAVAHVVVRTGRRGSGWWRPTGRVVIVMNAQFIGDADPTPRSHPGDGRLDVLDVDASLSRRARRQVRRRLRTGSHLPHPQLTVTSSPTHAVEFVGACTVVVDGRVWLRRRSGIRLAVRVRPDALTVWS